MNYRLLAIASLAWIGTGVMAPVTAHPSHVDQREEDYRVGAVIEELKGGQGGHSHHGSEEADANASTAPDMPHSEPHDSHHDGGSNGHHDESHDGHHSDGHGHGESHDPLFHHGSIDVSADELIPAITVVVHPDARMGWNVEIQTENFTFAPEQVNQANQPNRGHAHLYVDGVKLHRLYASWFHVESLEAGTRDITISLHANGHEVLVNDGEAIAQTVTVEVPAIDASEDVSEDASGEEAHGHSVAE